jgi:NAD(P)-dependent dehydrogenase (short-subunit alcohol dehydrogenase family)
MTASESAPKSALITGAGGGIGGAAAVALAKLGTTVGVADLDPDRAQAVVDTIHNHGGDAYAVVVDVADPASVHQMFARVDAGDVPPLDLLVNAAGVIFYEPLLTQSEQGLDQILNVNLKGSFVCLQEAARRMVPRREGSIINIASVASFVATRLPAVAYGMSKGGIRQLTIAAAIELAEHGVRVNAVAPGTIQTDFVKDSLNSEASIQRAIAGVPLGRLGTIDDVANAIVFLASAQASFITGQVVVVDGGRVGRAG